MRDLTDTQLIIVRHGETDSNRDLRFQGHLDVSLGDTGWEQAHRLARHLANETIDTVISSDLTRAQQTASTICARRLDTFLVTDTLRGQNLGVVEGMLPEDIKRLQPGVWARWTEFRGDYATPGGESRATFLERIVNTLREIAAAHTGRRVLVVTHGDVLDVVWRVTHGLGAAGKRQCDIPNAGINRVAAYIAHGVVRFDIEQWADVRHLAGMPPQRVYDQSS